MVDMKQPYFSIVIPTLNEEKYLPNLLNDLAEQSWSDFEVIHVDGYSDDKTVTIAKRFSKRFKLKQIISPRRSAPHQRNLGAEAANGEWIIFMDADIGFPADFLLTIRYKIAQADRKPRTRFDIFNSLIKLDSIDKKKAKHHAIAQTINSRLRSTAGSDKPLALGAMLGVRSNLFGAARFDEKVKLAEEIYFVRDLIALGAEYKLLRTPVFECSMRRWDDHGLAKNAVKALKLELKILLGDDYDDVDYEMLGGTKY